MKYSFAKKICQGDFEKFKFRKCKEASTPMNQKEKLQKEDGTDKIDKGYFKSLIDYLMYHTTIRIDILNVVSILSKFMHCANAVSILSRFMHCPSKLHLKAPKRVI